MTSQEAMEKAAKNLHSTLPPLHAQWAERLMRAAYEAGLRDAARTGEAN